MLEEARRQSQTLALSAVIAGGEYVDPVRELHEELFADVVERPDRALRQALGLST